MALKVRLTTLLGLDRYPAELAGWGAVHAELARTLVGQLGAAQWRFTFTSPSGHLLRTGLTTARPVGSDRRRASCEGVVQILVPVTLLPRLLPHLSAGKRAGDLDHRLDHAKGGPTVGENLNPLCRHDHRVKGEAGWQLRRIGDTFEWTTRLGHVYVVTIPPVLPDLPEQQPSPPEVDLPSDPPGHRRSEPEPQSERPRPHPDDNRADPDAPLPF